MLRLASEAIPEKKKRNIIDGIGKEQWISLLRCKFNNGNSEI
jgi:hypothetical protein